MTTTDLIETAIVNLPKVTVRFARDRAPQQAVEACSDLGIDRLLLVGTSKSESRYSHVWRSLTTVVEARFFGAEAHCPVEVVESCRQVYQANNCNGVVVIGGGSSIGLGKILAVEEQAKFVALPTTYSGSEMTSIYGRKIGGQKRTAIDDACRPDVVIYDGALSVGLPKQVSVASAMNSVAHAAEALYPKDSNPIAALLAEECLNSHKSGLTDLFFGRDEISARIQLLYGGCLGGLVIGMTGIALHHQLCHVIGGLFDLPHGESNSAVLPQALAYNRDYIQRADNIIADVFEGADAGRAVFDFADRLDAPLSLREIGMPQEGIDQAVVAMLAHGGYNPRPLEEEPLRCAIQRAYDGQRPD